MRKYWPFFLIALTLGVAIYFFSKRKKDEGVYDSGEVAPESTPTLPVFPTSIAINVKGKAKQTKSLGNIRVTSDVWQGSIGAVDGFVAFSDWSWGVRAMLKIFMTYKTKGIATIRGIVTRYAPQSDGNATEDYIRSVSAITGINADTSLTASDYTSVATAMIYVETGIPSSDLPMLKDYITKVDKYFSILS